jgi:hypothetical protein
LCTLTWTRRVGAGNGYELFFNRDELKTRRTALPPAVHEQSGVAYLAPTDAEGGGTWLGVNAHGLTVGLLNGWLRSDLREGDFTSRGLLVASLLDCARAREVGERVLARELDEFRSFTLVALEPGERLLRAAWDGEELDVGPLEDLEQPISSSSRDPEGACRRRRLLFDGLAGGALPTADQLESFHADHDDGPSACSPCMHREDAHTVSFTRILVDAETVELRYHPGAPCLDAEVEILRLKRAALPASAADR